VQDGIKSRRYTLFDELYGRYAMEIDPQAAEPAISTLIRPTIDVADLYPVELVSAALDLTGSAGAVVPAHTVPALQRFHIYAWHFDALTATSAITLQNFPQTITMELTAQSLALQLSLQTMNLGQALILDPGWVLGALTTGNAGDSARAFRILFRRERLN